MVADGAPVPFTLAAAWLNERPLQLLFDALERVGTAKAVGGAVRNTLLSEPIMDIDIATDVLPSDVERAAKAAGLSVHPTGLAHGTLTIVAAGRPFEVTTLREDVSTDGRRATVRFTTSYARDAGRRDFTMNALYVDRDGAGSDYVGGHADCLAGRVRFIGDPDSRILEDHLRILRYFRIHAAYGRGARDEASLAAAVRHRALLPRLSAERIGSELTRLVVAKGAVDAVATMASTGVLSAIVPLPWSADAFARLRSIELRLGVPAVPVRGLSALTGFDGVAFAALARTLRLSVADGRRAEAALAAADAISAGGVPRRLLYDHGAVAFTDGVLVALARGADLDGAALLHEAGAWRAPRCPVSGHDLIARGARPGPELGARLQRLVALWRDSDFSLDREALLAMDGAVGGAVDGEHPDKGS